MSEIEEGFLTQLGLVEAKTSWRNRTAKRVIAILIATLVVPISSVVVIPAANAVPNKICLSTEPSTTIQNSKTFAADL